MDYTELASLVFYFVALAVLAYLVYIALQQHFNLVSEAMKEKTPLLVYVDTSSPNNTIIKVSRTG